MIYDNIDFHNVEELEKCEGINGLRLRRFPKVISDKLGIEKNYRGRFMALRAQGCEIRFVSEAPFFELGLTALNEDTEVIIYRGDYYHSTVILKADEQSCIHVEYPEIFNSVNKSQIENKRFDCNVWRIVFGRNGSVCFNYLNTFGFSKRPPLDTQMPLKKWVAYGSSITCGCVSTTYANAYANKTALSLGYDLFNKAMSGSSLCEKEIAEYLSSIECDLLTLELGVNLVPFCSQDEFRKRIGAFLEIISKAKAKKIVVIDMFPNKGKICTDGLCGYYENYNAFKNIVIELVNTRYTNKFIHISGDDVLDSLSYLSTDLLHPGDDGHIMMSYNLTKIMKNLGI